MLDMKDLVTVFAELEARVNSFCEFNPKKAPHSCFKLADHWPAPAKDTDTNNKMIIWSIYGWRRDYGEWPSWMNLTDRLAHEMAITHEAAANRIAFALNDPSPEHDIYAAHKFEVEAAILGVEAEPVPFGFPADELILYFPPHIITVELDIGYRVFRSGSLAS